MFIGFFGFIGLLLAIGIEPDHTFPFHQPNEPHSSQTLPCWEDRMLGSWDAAVSSQLNLTPKT